MISCIMECSLKLEASTEIDMQRTMLRSQSIIVAYCSIITSGNHHLQLRFQKRKTPAGGFSYQHL